MTAVVDSRAFLLLVWAALLVAAVVDFRRRVVPPWVSLPLLALGAGRCLAGGNVLAVAALALALWDVRRGEPWTFGALALAGAATSGWTGRAEYALAVLLVLAVYQMWRARWIGGGDAKLLMAVFCMYPKVETVLAVAAGWLLLGLAALWRRYRRAFVPAALLSAAGRLPPAGSLEETGIPSAVGIALGFGLYLLWSIIRGL